MAHFAKLDKDNIVIDICVVNNDNIGNLPFPESESAGINFLNNWLGETLSWKQTSYNANFRKNYAGIGDTYDAVRDAFIAPKPYDSWVLNESTCRWQAPVPRPDGHYIWDESTVSWLLDD